MKIDSEKYSNIATKVLNNVFGDDYCDLENFHSIKVGVYKQYNFYRISVSFVSKKPFDQKFIDVFSDPDLKKNIKEVLKSIIPSFDLSTNTCTIDIWEKNYLPMYQKEWSEEKSEKN